MVHKCIIIGGGVAGLTASIYLARAGLEPLVIKGPNPSSHVMTTIDVEYFPGVPQGIEGPALLDNMFRQAELLGARFRLGTVTSVDLSKRPYTVVQGGDILRTESLIIATGSTAKYLGIPGEEQERGLRISTCAPCNGFFFRGKKVIVVGGGDSAMEEAEYLTRYASEVTIVHRRGVLRASQTFQEKVLHHPKVSLLLNRTPLEVLPVERGIAGLKVSNNETGEEETVPADGIFVAIGKAPNTQFLGGQLPTDSRGYLLVKPGTSETEIAGVFACGEAQDSRYGHLLTATGSGCAAAIDCERYLASE
ncbi:NAD(P)/FAD-dependent oxidoreductase [Paenibacillus humicola]|uniref:NAD(P)/FAD-dependent oxidoreductase n=1 Tax=Paenibacillus humicola TaxID=3110540 RepID=UPI00237B529A|nr:FAD-dependent oxidoreductase [Paenibacillus humicola]